MEPPSTNNQAGKKIVINSARGPGGNNGAYSERDPSGEPMKGMQMSQAYQSARLNPQLTQRKSRGGRDPQKNHQSVEPPNIHMQANSINAIGTPGTNWNKKAGHNQTSIVSPGLVSNYQGPDAKLSLREQLYTVKNGMNKQI